MMKNLKMDVKPGVNKKNLDDWQKKANAYTVTLKYDQRQMTVPFFMGPALSHEPTENDVIPCLLSDYSCVQYGDFEEFCANLGYDSDSRTSLSIYNQCLNQSKKLENLLGPDLPAFIEKYEDM